EEESHGSHLEREGVVSNEQEALRLPTARGLRSRRVMAPPATQAPGRAARLRTSVRPLRVRACAADHGLAARLSRRAFATEGGIGLARGSLHRPIPAGNPDTEPPMPTNNPANPSNRPGNQPGKKSPTKPFAQPGDEKAEDENLEGDENAQLDEDAESGAMDENETSADRDP